MLPQCRFSHPSLSIVVPIFNEEENIQPLIDAIFAVLAIDSNFLELVLVDDGSRDRSAELITMLAADEPRIRLVRHMQNRGLGAAIRTGLGAASGEIILYTDADLPFDFSLIPELLKCANEKNIVVGYRTNRGEGSRRWILTKGYNLVCRCLLGLRVSDVNFACKLIPRHTAQQMHLASEGSFIDAEIMLEARRLGNTIIEHPLTYQPRTRGVSTLSRPSVILGIIIEMTRYCLKDPFVVRKSSKTRALQKFDSNDPKIDYQY